MNGRAYDYNLGRFLSVDPIIQAPGNSQSLNPYSYVMNNPLAGTDPSGYAIEIVIRCGADNFGCDDHTPPADQASMGNGNDGDANRDPGKSDGQSFNGAGPPLPNQPPIAAGSIETTAIGSLQTTAASAQPYHQQNDSWMHRFARRLRKRQRDWHQAVMQPMS